MLNDLPRWLLAEHLLYTACALVGSRVVELGFPQAPAAHANWEIKEKMGVRTPYALALLSPRDTARGPTLWLSNVQRANVLACTLVLAVTVYGCILVMLYRS